MVRRRNRRRWTAGTPAGGEMWGYWGPRPRRPGPERKSAAAAAVDWAG